MSLKLQTQNIFFVFENGTIFVFKNCKVFVFRSDTFLVFEIETFSYLKRQKQRPEVIRKIHRKYLCQRLFFNKVAGVRSATLLKKNIWRKCFPVNYEKFLKTPFLQNTFFTWRLFFKRHFSYLKVTHFCICNEHFFVFEKVFDCSKYEVRRADTNSENLR